MGSKIEAKNFLLNPKNNLKVPIIPGYNGELQNDEIFIKEAAKIGIIVTQINHKS